MWKKEIELISEKYCEFELFFYEIYTILQNAGIEKRKDYIGMTSISPLVYQDECM